ncbi:uncharacterized protein LOC110981021 [Acanthaster planci]|uniref:Uncharacterized protein LOC110981021 n=1 Tax=Acanthaster planci TaxID=133434 RepID=A0A8B7YKR4_ACAPL|nr:uncharacterized protein LOC110981021 [Acanthaster planci]
MASSRHSQGPSTGRETNVDTATRKREGVKFVLHTGAVNASEVVICFRWEKEKLKKNGSQNLWSCEIFPPLDQSYYFQYCCNPTNTSASERTQFFKQSPSWPRHVHRNVVSENLPTTYFGGMVFHLQDLYAGIRSNNFEIKIVELKQLLSPSGGTKCDLREYLPPNKDDLKRNSLFLWVVQSLSSATSTSQLAFLSVLVANVSYHKRDSGVDIISIFDDAGLRKLISNLHKAPRSVIFDYSTEHKLKILVPKVLKELGEHHWLYVLLYCYPLFDTYEILDYTSKSRDDPPSSECITGTILPRLKEDTTVRQNRQLFEKTTDLLERQQKHQCSGEREKHEGAVTGASKVLKDEPLEGDTLTTSTEESEEARVLTDSQTTPQVAHTEQPMLQDVVKHPNAAMVGERNTSADSYRSSLLDTPEKTSLVTDDILSTPDAASQWTSYQFHVLLEAEQASGVLLYLYEDQGQKTHRMVIPMAFKNVSTKFSNTSWKRAYSEVKLVTGHKYRYKYAYKYNGGLRNFYKQVENTEQDERPVKSMVHEDVFVDTSSSLEKVLMGRVLHEVGRCNAVKANNLSQSLDSNHASEIRILKANIEDQKVIKSVQIHITELIKSKHSSDAQVIFLARLLGNCSTKAALPSLKKVGGTILQALVNCKEIIDPFLDQTKNKDMVCDLVDIVVHSLRTVQGSWLQLVQYTYPGLLNAGDLCRLQQNWKSDTSVSGAQLKPVPYEDLLSFCCKNCVSDDDARLLRLVFESNVPVKVLLQVLERHGQSPVFRDNDVYKSWVKHTIQKQMQTLTKENVEGLHDVWKMVYEMKTLALELLTREVVLEALTHCDEWSSNTAKNWFSDETFWMTSADVNLCSNFRAVLKKMLTQKNQQAGIDSFLTVVSKTWVTKWLSPEELEKLTEVGFLSQLQLEVQPSYLLPKMYLFLSTIHTTKWLEDLPNLIKTMDNRAKNFISEKNQLNTLLQKVFTNSLNDTSEIRSQKEIEIVTMHAIWMIQKRQITPYSACRLLSPYAPNGQLGVHSKPAADVTSTIIEVVSDQRDIFKILEDFSFWELIFQARGESASEIWGQERSKAVIQLLQSVQQSFVKMSVSVRFIHKLVKTKKLDELRLLCQMVTSHSKEVFAINEKPFQEAVGVIERHGYLLDKCEDFLTFYEGFAMNTCQNDLEAMREEVHLRRQDIHVDSNVDLKSLVIAHYWGVLHTVIEIAEVVSDIAKSKVFFNLCLCVVEEESYDMEEEQPLQVISFAELVSKKCLPKFRSLCTDIAQGCEGVRAGDIKLALNGVLEHELSVELDIMSRFSDETITDQAKVLLKSWVKLELIRQYAKQLRCLFQTFEVPCHTSCQLIQDVDMLLNIFESVNSTEPLQQVHLAVKRIEDVDQKFTDEDWRAIDELINFEELIQFLKPIIDDDLRNLTDAVEERSDSFVNESTVSDLIEVQRYMGSFLRVGVLDTPENLINAIAESRDLGIKNISDKIKTCNDHFHALKNLYNNIAQRGEMTKKIIHRCY